MCSYEKEKPKLFTEERQEEFLRIRDNVMDRIRKNGVVMVGKVLSWDSWFVLACIDRLIEIGEIHEVPNPYSDFVQHRILVEVKSQ